MNLLKQIFIAVATLTLLQSCLSGGDEFFGTWVNEYEDEVDGAGFYQQVETFTLNDDYTLTQSWAFLDGTHTDTIARASINGSWEINDSCLEISYNQATINVTTVMAYEEPIFFNHILAMANYANEQLKNAHNENTTFGIKNAAVDGNNIVSKGTTNIQLYTRKK